MYNVQEQKNTNKEKFWGNSTKCWIVLSINVHEGRESVLSFAVLPAPYIHTKNVIIQ